MLRITDATNFRRTLAGISLLAAPATGLIATLVAPAASIDAAERLAIISEEPARFLIASVLSVLTGLLLVPAVIGLVHLVRDRGVVLAHIGGALVTVGILGYTGVVATELLLLPMSEGAADRAQM